jgi:DNA-binding response OmpR family regulator
MDKQLISVIDDDEFIQRMLRDALEMDGFRTAISSSAEDCYRKLGSDVPDLFIIDILLPGQDGIQLCQNLRKQPVTRHIPIIMLSSKAKVQDRIIGLEAGADDYLVKPFHLDELMARIKALLRRGSDFASTSGVPATPGQTGRNPPQGNDNRQQIPLKHAPSQNSKPHPPVRPNPRSSNSSQSLREVDPVVTNIEILDQNADIDTKKKFATELYQRRMYEKAYNLFETLSIENPKDQYVKKYLEVTKTSLMKMFLQILGSRDAVPVRTSDHPEDFIGLDFNSQEGFIFSRIDGVTDFKGIVAISGMKPLTAYRILYHLMQSGVIKIKK